MYLKVELTVNEVITKRHIETNPEANGLEILAMLEMTIDYLQNKKRKLLDAQKPVLMASKPLPR